ncbi:exodeoxyribonuclease VII large subunit [Ligilactobacillus ceti]|uniref:Exodeoxyribonuclease 7 large subunit n=1 Tax=Ligilactobacillus ceti DSM 22408 TaxID=1122146 RepID=A0A0R2KH29_9LACO|nr:exodeoxyribonuclease VII large subunit [Ligilactobacillus ceti]KRN88670.1 exodeoxyribonuclease VII large subunit [Ligilactobacillus ceti DSM 22408]
MSTKQNYLTVSALTQYVKRKFTADPYLKRVYVTGEISNFRMRPKHQYFSLKDDKAVIDAVMYKWNFSKLKFNLEEGMNVLAIGYIDVYPQNGNYQFYIEDIQPDGVGALYQAYNQLKAKLAQDGLFALPKKPLPKFPKKIAVITSPSGAVIRDIINTVRRRYPIAQIVLFPAVVQGNNAAPSLVKQIQQVNEIGGFDTIIIGRGGGSIEDLWAFNEEPVARAIVASQIPVISSVGHETDTTIADLVADQRAATPTAAAELAVPVLTEEVWKLEQQRNRLIQALKRKIDLLNARLNQSLQSYLFMQPTRLYEAYLQRIDNLTIRNQQAVAALLRNKQQAYFQQQAQLQTVDQRQKIQQLHDKIAYQEEFLMRNVERLLHDKKQAFANQCQALDMLSPLKIMGKGYLYATYDHQVVTSVADLTLEQDLDLYLQDGQATATIKEIKKGDNFDRTK